ncbi:MAG: ribonuclease Y [Nitrospinae bacterium]|nr:ribonuclease Y [Nitrospinota bacterium]
MDSIGTIIIPVVSLLFGGIGFYIRGYFLESKLKNATNEAAKIIEASKSEAQVKYKEVLIEAKEESLKVIRDAERKGLELQKEGEEALRKVQRMEEEFSHKEKMLKRNEEELSEKSSRLDEHKESLKHLEEKYERLVHEEIEKLEKIANYTIEEAKGELKIQLLDDVRRDCSADVKKILAEAKENSEKEATKLISLAVQRVSADHIAESTISVVDLPSDDMKGRIIGREGRNIRALEQATGVDIIVDDTPGAVVLSSFDPIRRETARLALNRLIHDGRIHPGKIESIVEKAKKEVINMIREEGEKAAFEVGVDNLHPDLIKLLGRLKFRTSYSQNVLLHSKEVAILCGIMATELGHNAKIAKRAGLLHDIGKAVDHQTQGTHVQIGIDLAKKYNEDAVVINSIASHHEDCEAQYIISTLVAAADTLSASRPGARREMLENYTKRLRDLEEIGDSFKGVDKTYAIQAGREVRVMVEPEKLDDANSSFLAKDIAEKIKKEMTYPGEIKVVVIREQRFTEVAN